MTDQLFRQEALTANRRGPSGVVALHGPPYRWLLLGVVVAFVGSIVVLFTLGGYTARERATGELVPMKGVLNVTPVVSGTVTEVFVREGQAVERGAPLIALSSEIATRLGDERAQIGEQLRRQRVSLERDLAAQATLGDEAVRDLRLQGSLLRAQATQAGEQLAQRRRQVALAREKLARWRALREQGYVSNGQLAEQEATALDADVGVREATRQQLDLAQQLAKVAQQLRAAPVDTAVRQREIERQLADVDQRLVENEAQRATMLRAPRAGTVAALLVEPGRTVGAGETVAELLPEGAQLAARLMVPSRAIGFVREGDRVVLRYQAYPHQKFRQQYGRVSAISDTALSPREIAVLTGDKGAHESLYRVVVALDRQDVEVYGRTEPLRAGMAVEADVLLEHRSLIEWLFEPLYALGRRAAT